MSGQNWEKNQPLKKRGKIQPGKPRYEVDKSKKREKEGKRGKKREKEGK